MSHRVMLILSDEDEKTKSHHTWVAGIACVAEATLDVLAAGFPDEREVVFQPTLLGEDVLELGIPGLQYKPLLLFVLLWLDATSRVLLAVDAIGL